MIRLFEDRPRTGINAMWSGGLREERGIHTEGGDLKFRAKDGAHAPSTNVF